MPELVDVLVDNYSNENDKDHETDSELGMQT